MIRAFAPLVLLLALSPAGAAERRAQVGSFDRVRVAGPFDVTFTTGSPAARVSGDADAVDRVEVRAEGSTLIVRAASSVWGERPRDQPPDQSGRPVTVTLSSPALTQALVYSGGRLRIGRVRGPRLSLAVNGAGSIQAEEVFVDRLDAGLLGTGAITVAGRAGRASLRTSGAGRIEAGKLQADELTVVLEGPGETNAAARVQASVTNLGLGAVTVAGRPRCVVKAPAGGAVRCGD